MKHIVFKKFPLVTPAGQKAELDYRSYIEVAIKNPLDGKLAGIEEMHKSLRLLNALEKATEEGCDFEDADYEYLCSKVKALKFTWVDPAFVQFIDDVTGL